MSLIFQDGVPYSSVFDDVYFSKENGLEESRYNFLVGNNLPAAWQNKENFIVAELGFGTGLNFLITMQSFLNEPGYCKELHFISIEKYPLTKEQIRQSLGVYRDELGQVLSDFLETYEMPQPGYNKLCFKNNIHLTLIIDDVVSGFPTIHQKIDAWFFDGFNPKNNFDMWQDSVFEHVKKLSHNHTSFSTFTAAGFVKRSLKKHGFHVEKTKGYGCKRERLIGWLDDPKQ